MPSIPMRYCQKSGDWISDNKAWDLTAECVSKAVGNGWKKHSGNEGDLSKEEFSKFREHPDTFGIDGSALSGDPDYDAMGCPNRL